MSNNPKPVAAPPVQLPPELDRLVELLARHNHNQPAQRSLGEGWEGHPANDTPMHHPRQVSYDELPVADQASARKDAAGTIKTMLAWGYEISVPKRDAESASHRPAILEAFLDTLSDKDVELPALLELWRDRVSADWAGYPEVYRCLAERLIELGESLVAYDVAMEGLTQAPNDVRLRQIQGVSLSQCGALTEARRVFDRLHDEGHEDEETLGALAGIHLALGKQSDNPQEQAESLRRGSQLFAEAYERTGGYWSGINAAILAAFRHDDGEARRIAARVQKLCLAELDKLDAKSPKCYWPLATLGDAALLLGEWDAAVDWYQKAVQSASRDLGCIAATRKQALSIAEHAGHDTHALLDCFPLTKVVVFAGHMIDRPERELPRFPPDAEEDVRRAIRESLAELRPVIGYASAACGADLLFLEEMLARNDRIHVVLPYEREQFLSDCVRFVDGANWEERFDRVLARADHVTTASMQRLVQRGLSYEYANRQLSGLARLHAQQLGIDLVALAVWDGERGRGAGGTASMVEYWNSLDIRVTAIDPLATTQPPRLLPAGSVPDVSTREGPDAGDTRLVALLFADVKGFSQLDESKIPLFVEHFVGTMGKLVDESPEPPLTSNTWGDALYCSFATIIGAGRFALDLRDAIAKTPWEQHGLPADLSIRIALHVGPVYRCTDPVTRKEKYTGTHVSRAARLEPVTPPGRVYASQAFAALVSLYRITEFVCDYVGQVPMPKNYGTFPTYHVRRRVE